MIRAVGRVRVVDSDVVSDKHHEHFTGFEEPRIEAYGI